MKKIQETTLLCLALLIPTGVNSSSTRIHAQEQSASPPTDKRIVQRRAVPSEFDEQTVVSLLQDVTNPGNADMLKYIYFGNRRPTTYAVADARTSLQKMLLAEPEHSKRWFRLQDVQAWTSFQGAKPPVDNGFTAYSALFDAASKAKSAKAVGVVEQAIIEYVLLLSSRIKDEGLLNEPRSSQTFAKAWKAYFLLIQNSKLLNDEPDWIESIRQIDSDDKDLSEIAVEIVDGTQHSTFNMLWTAAFVLQSGSSDKTVKAYEKAKVLILEARKEQRLEFYSQYIDFLSQPKSPKTDKVNPMVVERIRLLKQEMEDERVVIQK